MDDRTFPILDSGRGETDPKRIPWEIAQKAYHGYASRHGTGQSMQRMAERGGFAISEMDEYCPGWRELIETYESRRPITIRDEIAEVEREIALRRRVYPNWIRAGRLKAVKADRQIAALEAVLQRLRGIADASA